MDTVVQGEQCAGSCTQVNISISAKQAQPRPPCPECGHDITLLSGLMVDYRHKHTPDGVLIVPPPIRL